MSKEGEPFTSWNVALAEGKLNPSQMAVLEDMVRTGEAATIEDAASRLDWQATVITPDEHLWGF